MPQTSLVVESRNGCCFLRLCFGPADTCYMWQVLFVTVKTPSLKDSDRDGNVSSQITCNVGFIRRKLKP